MTKNILSKKFKRRGGFTLVELLVVLVLSALVLAVSARLFFSAGSITSISDFFTSQESQTRYTAERINNAIKYTNALFTIPQSSFNFGNLTKSWSYLGIMENVRLTYELISERDGKETADYWKSQIGAGGKTVATANGVTVPAALVYIKYIGSPVATDEDYIKASDLEKYNKKDDASFTKEPFDQYIYENDEGYFFFTILDYQLFNEKLGYETEYTLEFNTTNDVNSGNVISDSIKYSLKVVYKDKNGNVIGEGSNIDLETMLNGINMLQAVYQGSKSDPATAIAFHEGGFKVDSAPHANIIFVLDLSGSMSDNLPAVKGVVKTRLQVLKENVHSFLAKFNYDSVYVSFVEFSTYGRSGKAPVNVRDSSSALTTYVNRLAAVGGTNLGDGLRVAYTHLEQIVDDNPGAVNIIIKITDGFTNAWSVNLPTIMAEYVTAYNAKVDAYNKAANKKEKKLSDDLKYKLITGDECGGIDNYYWPSNKSVAPDYVLYYDYSKTTKVRYIFYPNANKTSYSSINLMDSYLYNFANKTYKGTSYDYSFQYTKPSDAQLQGTSLPANKKFNANNFESNAVDYALFCIDKIKQLGQNDEKYRIAAIYDIYLDAAEVQAGESDMIKDAFTKGIENTEYFSYSVNNEAEFVDCIGRLVANINTSAWLLNGPKV